MLPEIFTGQQLPQIISLLSAFLGMIYLLGILVVTKRDKYIFLGLGGFWVITVNNFLFYAYVLSLRQDQDMVAWSTYRSLVTNLVILVYIAFTFYYIRLKKWK